jgi:hypothetical protein
VETGKTLSTFIFCRNRLDTSFVTLLLRTFARFSLSTDSFRGLPRGLFGVAGLPSAGELSMAEVKRRDPTFVVALANHRQFRS